MQSLIIVDVQNDFLPGGSLPVKEGDQIIPILNEWMDKVDLVIATKDTHPENHISFADTHKKMPGEVITIKGVEQVLWPIHCVKGLFGWELPKALNTNKIDEVVEKGVDPSIDSYSGFFDNTRSKQTSLHELLQRKHIDTVIIAGLALDYCVKATALDAKELGYHTKLLLGGCKAVNVHPEDGEKAVKEMHEKGIEIIA